MKVAGIGLPKTGTTSLRTALEILGYNSPHSPLSWEQCIKFDTLVDTRAALWYRRIYEEFPYCKFIFTHRPLEDWLKSAQTNFSKPASDLFRPWRMLLFGRVIFEPKRWQTVFLHHVEEVRYWFDIHDHKRLLNLGICQGEGWEPLCQFLNKPIPAAPFPLENQSPK